MKYIMCKIAKKILEQKKKQEEEKVKELTKRDKIE